MIILKLFVENLDIDCTFITHHTVAMQLSENISRHYDRSVLWALLLYIVYTNHHGDDKIIEVNNQSIQEKIEYVRQ